MANTWFIADTHFYHEKIISYESRPFDSVESMNKTLMENWNRLVKNNDKIYILGDFALTNKANLKSLVRKLNGYKVLIMGNHDQYSPKVYQDAGFDEVSRYPIIINKFLILSHAPIYINDNMPYANIFGHVHSSKMYKDFTEQSVCISVERAHMHYSPIDFKTLVGLMGYTPDDILEKTANNTVNSQTYS